MIGEKEEDVSSYWITLRKEDVKQRVRPKKLRILGYPGCSS
jgi:hypothetical protein